MAQKRGVIISPLFESIPDGVVINGAPSSLDIRKYLLYWDEIDYPDNNILSVKLSDDMAFLENCSVLKRTKVKFQGNFPIDGRIMIAAQEMAFRINEEQENGQWSFAQLSDTQYYTNSKTEDGIEFELVNCLPVPQADVPLNDILEFKGKRQDELIALRIHLDDLYQSIINAGDIPRAKNTEIDRLGLALQDLNKAADDHGLRKLLTCLRGTIPTAVDSGLRGAGISALFGVPYAKECFLAWGAISLAIKPMLLPETANNSHPLTYLKSIRTELGE